MITAAEARSNRINMSKILNSISNLIGTVSAGQSFLNIEFSGGPCLENRFPDLTDRQSEVIGEALTKAGYKYEWTAGLSNSLKLNINW
jgi:hypothetical protein